MNYVTLPFLGLAQALSTLSTQGFMGRQHIAARAEAPRKRR